MTTSWVRGLILSFCIAYVGCGDDDTEGSTGGDSGADSSNPGDGGGNQDSGGDPDGQVGDASVDAGGSSWTLTAHPCVGNRTDTLWRDEDGTMYVGCGSTTEGTGLYLSTDDGATWSKPTTTPVGFFDTWRVFDVSRGSNNLLYVAGIDTASNRRVVLAETEVASWALDEVYNAGQTVGTAFTVGTFRRDSDGRAFAESENGTDIQVRDSDEGDWVDGSDWGGSPARQIRDLEIHDDRVFGCGDRISEPPVLYLEDQDAETFTMSVVELATGIGAFDGELETLAVDDEGILVGGVNQDANAGVVYAVDPDDPNGDGLFDLRTLYPDDPTWIRGVCKSGSTYVAVGELSALERGLIIVSDDGGENWTEITPVPANAADKFPPVHQCVIDGADLYVAGAGGVVARGSL